MRRGVGRVNRYVMIKNRWEKNVFRAYYMGLPMFLTVVFLSCAPVSYDFIGTWDRQPNKLTYVNHDQHMKVTFPNHKWQVHTKPPSGNLGKIWVVPTKADSSYHLMLATVQPLVMLIQILVEPVQVAIDLEDYLSLAVQRIKKDTDSEMLRSKVVERAKRTIGVGVFKLPLKGKGNVDMKGLFVVLKEKGRFTTLMFGCPESLFESKTDQFWAIVDSYEYIE